MSLLDLLRSIHLDDPWQAKGAQMDDVLRSIEASIDAFAMAVEGDNREESS